MINDLGPNLHRLATIARIALKSHLKSMIFFMSFKSQYVTLN